MGSKTDRGASTISTMAGDKLVIGDGSLDTTFGGTGFVTLPQSVTSLAVNLGGAYRSDGVDIEALAGGGYAVDYTHVGEYLKYTVYVPVTGTYTFDAHLANYGAGANFDVQENGVEVTNTLAVPDTKTFTNYTDVTQAGIHLTRGTHVLTFAWQANSGTGFAGNLDWFQFS